MSVQETDLYGDLVLALRDYAAKQSLIHNQSISVNLGAAVIARRGAPKQSKCEIASPPAAARNDKPLS